MKRISKICGKYKFLVRHRILFLKMNDGFVPEPGTWQFNWDQHHWWPRVGRLNIRAYQNLEQRMRDKIHTLVTIGTSLFNWKEAYQVFMGKLWDAEKAYEEIENPDCEERIKTWRKHVDFNYDYAFPTNAIEYTYWPWEEDDYYRIDKGDNEKTDQLIEFFEESNVIEFTGKFPILGEPTRWMELKFILAMMTKCELFRRGKLNVYIQNCVGYGKCTVCEETCFVTIFHPFAEYDEKFEPETAQDIFFPANERSIEFFGDSRKVEALCETCCNNMHNCSDCCKALGFEWGLRHYIDPGMFTKSSNKR